MNQTATLTKEDGHMADKEFKRLIHSWWTVLLPKKTHVLREGRDLH